MPELIILVATINDPATPLPALDREANELLATLRAWERAASGRGRFVYVPATGKRVSTLPATGKETMRASADGSVLATWTAEGVVRFWPIPDARAPDLRHQLICLAELRVINERLVRRTAEPVGCF